MGVSQCIFKVIGGKKGCENEDCELWGCKGGLIDRGGLAWER